MPDFQGECTLSIENIFGQVVYKSNFVDKKFTAKISSLTNGIYTVKIKLNNQSYSEKIIIAD